MDVMVRGWAIGLRQASQAASMMSSYVLKTRLDSQVWRRYCQMFSTGVQLRGAGRQQDHGDVLRDFEGACRVPAGAIEQQHGMAPRLALRAISSRWSCMACVSAKGSARAAPVSRAGQMAPNRYALS
jgi:hypothetical protein